MHPRTILAIVSFALAASTAHAADRVPHDPRASGSCPADLTGDGVVDDSDFVQFADAYNTLDCADPAMAAGCPADLNSDAFVDDADFVLFASAYNELLCPAGEVVLRDSIGPDNTMTNGGRVIPTYTQSSAGFDFIGFSFSPTHAVRPSELSIVVGEPFGIFPGIQWDAFNYRINIWSSPDAVANDSDQGDVLSCIFDYPSNFVDNSFIPPAFGWAVGQSPFDLPATTYLLVFDLKTIPALACPGVVLDPQHVYVIGVQPERPQFVSTAIGTVTSHEAGPTDVRYPGLPPTGIPVTEYSTPDLPLTGRVGYTLKGVLE